MPVLNPVHDAARQLIERRRTIHLFQPERPADQRVLDALASARWAPNHRLTEPWRFYLLSDETADAVARLNADLVTVKRGEVAGQAKYERWAAVPGWLAVTHECSEDPIRNQEDYAATACVIQNLSLLLWAQGIGMKWTTGAVTRDPRFFDLLQINTKRERLVGLLWYGYPATVPQTQRQKSVAEIVTRC
ncbi:MAG: nitroreductase [Rhodothermales bacterium]